MTRFCVVCWRTQAKLGTATMCTGNQCSAGSTRAYAGFYSTNQHITNSDTRLLDAKVEHSSYGRCSRQSRYEEKHRGSIASIKATNQADVSERFNYDPVAKV